MARKSSRELLMESKKAQPGHAAGRVRSQSRDHTVEIGLSRKSALNDRYFEDKPGRSRSLDNLLESVSISSTALHSTARAPADCAIPSRRARV